MKDSMFKLKQKLDQLLVVSEQETHWGKPDGMKQWEKKKEQQETLFDELRELAIANDTLLGRIVKFQTADSYAVYVVTRLYKNQVQVTWKTTV